MRNSAEFERFVAETEAELVKQGKIVAGGFAGYRMLVMDVDAPEDQVRECMLAFFAGAQHLFTTLMRIMDRETEEPTEADLRAMDQINAELQDFTDKVLEPMHAASVRTRGNA